MWFVMARTCGRRFALYRTVVERFLVRCARQMCAMKSFTERLNTMRCAFGQCLWIPLCRVRMLLMSVLLFILSGTRFRLLVE